MQTVMRRAGWAVLLLGLLLLIIAHLMALVFRIQPAVSLWFPPSGVALALAIWFGPIGVALTWIASFVMAPMWGIDGWARLASWTDATEPLVSWLLYRYYWQGSQSLKSLRDVVAFIISAPILGCITSAVLGSLTLVAIGKMPGENLMQIISHWWLGNAIGTMTLAPPALLLLTPYLQKRGRLCVLKENQEDLLRPALYTPQSKLRFYVELLVILVFSFSTAIMTVSQARETGFSFQQFSFLNFVAIIWAASRFGAIGGTLIASFCVFATLASYLIAYPDAISSPSFPVSPEVLHVHKLSLVVQCVVSLLLGTAIAQQAAT